MAHQKTEDRLEFAKRIKRIEDSLIPGYIIIFDLVNSTQLKKDNLKSPQDWISIIVDFYEKVTQGMEQFLPLKFLGDGILYFYPDFNAKPELRNSYGEYLPNGNNGYGEFNPVIALEKANEIVNLIDQQNFDLPDKYKYYITVSLDYGEKIYDISNSGLGDANSRDFIGYSIDRAFRFSSINGANFIACSKDYYEKASSLNPLLKMDFEKFVVKEGKLKGIAGDQEIYVFSKGYSDEKSFLYKRLIQNENLIEDDKLLGTNSKIHLLRKIILNEKDK